MRPFIPLTLCVMIIAGVSAAEAQRRADPQAGSAFSADSLALAVTTLQAPPQAPQAQLPPPPPPPPERPRRRGSMVGYIEDPVIASRIRIRFDAGFHNNVPDRAEFFYAKCGCYSQVPDVPALFDPDAPGPLNGAASDIDFQQLYIWAEYAWSDRLSVFGQLPFRWLQPQSFIPQTGPGFPDRSGIEDVRAGIKVGITAKDNQSLTGQLRFFFPTGEARKGLGTDHATVEPALLFFQRLNEFVSVESQFGAWIPVDGAAPVPASSDGTFAGDVIFYGIGPSVVAYRGDRVQIVPVVELVGWRVLNGQLSAGGNLGGDAGGTNIVNLKAGVRAVAGRGSFYVGYGRALTDEFWYRGIVRFEYRYDF